MTTTDEPDAITQLYDDRAIQQTILLAYQRKLAREQTAVDALRRDTFTTERDYRLALADLVEARDDTLALIARSEDLLAGYADCIVDAWLDQRVKPTDIPEPWGPA